GKCAPADFLYSPGASSAKTLGRYTYRYATSVGAAAGNLYEQSVYATKKGNRCFAIRYMIHSGNIANYPAGAVKAFDRQKLISLFDSISATLKIY
ncbi:hypothetical protein KW799_02810, partial [Candidatus Parcubacteria bacterium]|nr:hypothetical protein [Candidatus Parcubacteria bacterium]